MNAPAVQFHNVWKKFRRAERHDSLRDLIPAITRRLFSHNPPVDVKGKEFWALRDVSFNLDRGDSIAIIGPNGSGKSTTLKLLSRILRPDRGTARVNGRIGALIELGAGFHPDLTGRENIYLNGAILGMKRAEIQRKFDAIVEFSELQDFLDMPVKRYSSGMYARLGFSVAAHMEPEVLIVDEVLSVGDYHFQEKCFTKMREFSRNGTTLVFVSHNLAAVSSLCKTALLLKQGETVYQGDVRPAVGKYYSFYEENNNFSRDVELTEIRLTGSDGQMRDVFDPGDTACLSITFRALTDISQAHACLYIQTRDGLSLFDTATSRHTDARVTLCAGESAAAVFRVQLNLRSEVFRFGFSISSEFDEYFLFCNMSVKQFVMTGDRKANGFVHFDPSASLVFGKTSFTNGDLSEDTVIERA
jgi:lipopolysaccharide transport system ATP-binding protein